MKMAVPFQINREMTIFAQTKDIDSLPDSFLDGKLGIFYGISGDRKPTGGWVLSTVSLFLRGPAQIHFVKRPTVLSD